MQSEHRPSLRARQLRICTASRFLFRAAQIGIAKIVWGDASTPTTIYQVTFNDGAALTEAAFDSSTNLVVNTALVDPTTCTNVLLGGARYSVDELRIGTSFDDVIGIVPGSQGTYWAPTSRGGSGIWASGTNNWAPIPNLVGGLSQSAANTLIFAGTNGTITVNGTVTAGAGLQFSVAGYRLVPGSSTPQLNLTATSWTPLDGSGVGAGTDSAIILSDPSPVESLPAQRFYRIQVQ
jgi:hypothetical protein